MTEMTKTPSRRGRQQRNLAPIENSLEVGHSRNTPHVERQAQGMGSLKHPWHLHGTTLLRNTATLAKAVASQVAPPITPMLTHEKVHERGRKSGTAWHKVNSKLRAGQLI